MSRFRPARRGQKRGAEVSDIVVVSQARSYFCSQTSDDHGPGERDALVGGLHGARHPAQDDRQSNCTLSSHRLDDTSRNGDPCAVNPPPALNAPDDAPPAFHLHPDLPPNALSPQGDGVHPPENAPPSSERRLGLPSIAVNSLGAAHLGHQPHSGGPGGVIDARVASHPAADNLADYPGGRADAVVDPFTDGRHVACDAASDDHDCDDGASVASNYFGKDPYDGAFDVDVGEDDVPYPVEPVHTVGSALGELPFQDFTEFFCFYYLRGQAGVTQLQFDIMRAFIQDVIPGSKPPSLSYIRKQVLPRVRQAWGLPLRTVSSGPAVEGGQQQPPLLLVFPSDHIARDFAFKETFELFTAADRRTDADRALHPEFCDSRLFQDRQASTMAGGTVRRFVLGGEVLTCGDAATIEFMGDAEGPRAVTIGAGSFATSAAGLQPGDAVHAGDFVVPCTSDDAMVGSLVVRHWRRADNYEICWVAVDGCVVGVGCVKLLPRDEAATGAAFDDPPRRRRLLSGISMDGERWYTASFALYSDDFDGLGGVYMSYLSWLFKHRTSRLGGRVLSLTARGVCSDAVLRAVIDDFVAGAHDGWVVEDPDGVKVRVYADVAFYVGDYEQVSKSSHLRGHNARAPCNLCAYAKARGGQGSVYAQEGTSEHIGLARTTARTVAVVQAALAADVHA